MFSLTLIAKVPPLVPKPAPALISPVGFSSTSIFTIFRLFSDPCTTSYLTSLKIFLDLISEIDFSRLNFVKGSPSSNVNSPLMTDSFVTLFPTILILSTKTFSPSKILNFIEIESFTIVFTLYSTNCKLFFSIISSISSKRSFTLNGE